MARIVRFHQTGGPEVLRIEEVPPSPPGEGEVRIAVKAIGLNRAESLFRQGMYLEAPNLPSRLGYEASGTVALRMAVSHWTRKRKSRLSGGFSRGVPDETSTRRRWPLFGSAGLSLYRADTRHRDGHCRDQREEQYHDDGFLHGSLLSNDKYPSPIPFDKRVPVKDSSNLIYF